MKKWTKESEEIRMLFFELIQVVLGNRGELSRVPTAKEWSDLYDESERQALTGVMVSGLEWLPKEQRPEQELLLQWIGISEQIRQGNLSLTKRCKELQGKLVEIGHESSILKGQGVALYYDEPLRDLRQSGDIDIFVDCGLKGTIEIAHRLGVEKPEWDYKHLHLDVFEDAEVEMHYRVEVLLNLRKNRRLQKWFKNNIALLYSEKDGLTTPTTQFNVFYILLHIYRHFLYEGVGMRQIVDYYMVLRTVHGSRFTVHDYVDAVSQFGMERFAKGLMWVMQEALGMSREWMLWEPDEKEGKYILDEVMAGGNFGHHDQRLQHGGGKWNTVKQVCRHNWHLMRHYPADVVWAPVWFVWHKCWKLKTKLLLSINANDNHNEN